MSITKVELLHINGGYLQDLTGWLEGSRMWTDPRRGFGTGTIAVHVSHADASALSKLRMVRYTLDSDPDATFTWVLQRKSFRRISTDGEVGWVVTWTGDGALSYLGTEEFGHAIVVGNDNGLLPFGWIAKDFDDGTWTSPAPHSGGHQGAPRLSAYEGMPDRWPDEKSEWLWVDSAHADADGWFRHVLDVHGAQTATLYLTGTCTAWFNGEEVLQNIRPTEFARTGIDLTGDDLLAVKALGEAMWVIGAEQPNGEFQVLYRSTTGAPFDVSQNEIQHVSLDPAQPPFPWGSDYPSTGPDDLQGTWALTVPGYGSTPAVRDPSALQWDDTATELKAALEAIPGITTVTVSGSNTPSDPFVIEFTDPGGTDIGLMQIDHSDLRHDHDDTWVKVVQQGKSTPVATGGANKISFTATTPTGVTYGYVMTRLISLAKARGAIPGVTTNITDTLDKNGNAWSVSLPIYQARDGDQLGDLAIALTQDFSCDCRMLPDLEFAGYDTLGTDVSASVQLEDEDPSPANNAVSRATLDESAPRATRARVETDGGFGWAVDTAAEATWGRRETKVTYGQASSVEEVEQAALSTLGDSGDSNVQRIRSHGPTGARPYTDYGPGDEPGVREANGGLFLAARVEDITVRDLPAGEVLFELTTERRP